MGGIYLDVPVFKCPICGGEVGAEIDAWGKPKEMCVIFKCHGCRREVDCDATDLLLNAVDEFEAMRERIEGE